MFLDLTELASYIGVTAAGDMAGLTEDAEGACQWVEDQAGPVMARTVTERAWSSGSYLRLAEEPVSVTTVDDVALDGLVLVPGGAFGTVAAGWHVVVYEVGSVTAPAWAVAAARAKAKQLWQTRLGPKAGAGNVDYGARAEGLISAHRRGARP